MAQDSVTTFSTSATRMVADRRRQRRGILMLAIGVALMADSLFIKQHVSSFGYLLLFTAAFVTGQGVRLMMRAARAAPK